MTKLKITTFTPCLVRWRGFQTREGIHGRRLSTRAIFNGEPVTSDTEGSPLAIMFERKLRARMSRAFKNTQINRIGSRQEFTYSITVAGVGLSQPRYTSDNIEDVACLIGNGTIIFDNSETSLPSTKTWREQLDAIDFPLTSESTQYVQHRDDATDGAKFTIPLFLGVGSSFNDFDGVVPGVNLLTGFDDATPIIETVTFTKK